MEFRYLIRMLLKLYFLRLIGHLVCVLHCSLTDITVEPQSIRMDMSGNSFIWKMVGPSSAHLTGERYLSARCGHNLMVCRHTHSILVKRTEFATVSLDFPCFPFDVLPSKNIVSVFLSVNV